MIVSHEFKIVMHFEWKATNDQLFSKMDVLKFSVKLSSGREPLLSCKAGDFSIAYDPVSSRLMTPSQHVNTS